MAESLELSVDRSVEDLLPANPAATFSPGRQDTVNSMRSPPATATVTDSVLARSRRSMAFSVGDLDLSGPGTPDGRDYVLRKLIGAGGFGEVWEAEQTILDRHVAVKRLRGDLRERIGDNSDAARAYMFDFHQEAILSAGLDHPNIVPIYDLGIGDDGFPLLAMKLVQGTPWDILIANEFEEMPVADFVPRHVGILLSVAQAIAFAHSRGIIHRDIKPSQVIVGDFGEVFLMDWGLALRFDRKAIDPPGESGEAKAVSAGSNPAGTTAYMAPEQTISHPRALGPWTDVFLLGGALYFILTGRNPHEGETSKDVFYRAAYSRVEPPEQRRPDREIPPELSHLCMRALERWPARRMQTAREFAQCLQEFQSGAGRKREAAVVAQKIANRLAGDIGTYEEFAEYWGELERAAGLAPDNQRIPALRDQLAERYAREALRHGDLVLARAQARQVAHEETRVGLFARIDDEERAERALARQRRFALGAVAVLLAMTLAGGILFTRQLGLERDSAESARRQSEAIRDNAESLSRYIITDLHQELERIGRVEVLATAADRVRAHYDSLPVEARTPQSELNHARTLLKLSSAAAIAGDPESAVRLGDEAILIARTLRDSMPSDSLVELMLGDAMAQQGFQRHMLGQSAEGMREIEEGVAILRRVYQRGAGSDEVAEAMVNALVNAARVADRAMTRADAMGFYNEAGALARMRVELDPSDYEWKRRLAVVVAQQSQDLIKKGDLAGALARMEEGRDLVKAWMDAEPDNPHALREYSTALGRIGGLLADLGRIEEAERAHLDELSSTEKLVRIDPANTNWRGDLAHTNIAVGAFYEKIGNRARARLHCQRGVEMLEPLVAAMPRNSVLIEDLATGTATLAGYDEREGRLNEALARYRRATELGDLLLDISPQSIKWRLLQARTLVTRAGATAKTGGTSESLELVSQGVGRMREVVEAQPDSLSYRRDLGVFLNRKGGLEADAGELERARETYRESIGQFTKVAEAPDLLPRVREPLALTTARLGFVELRLGNTGKARTLAREAVGRYDSIEGPDRTPRILARSALAPLLEGEAAAAEGDDEAAALAYADAARRISQGAQALSDPAVQEINVRVLFRMGKRDDAIGVARQLIASGYREKGFIDFCREHRLLTEPEMR